MTPAKPEEKLLHSGKELAAALGRSEDYVGLMKKGGFRLPAKLSEAVIWIRENGPVWKFRHQ